MTPTVGRIVHVYPGNRADLISNGLGPEDPVAAIVTRVWGPGDSPSINVVAFVDGPAPVWSTSIPGGDTRSTGCRWEWPARTT